MVVNVVMVVRGDGDGGGGDGGEDSCEGDGNAMAMGGLYSHSFHLVDLIRLDPLWEEREYIYPDEKLEG